MGIDVLGGVGEASGSPFSESRLIPFDESKHSVKRLRRAMERPGAFLYEIQSERRTNDFLRDLTYYADLDTEGMAGFDEFGSDPFWPVIDGWEQLVPKKSISREGLEGLVREWSDRYGVDVPGVVGLRHAAWVWSGDEGGAYYPGSTVLLVNTRGTSEENIPITVAHEMAHYIDYALFQKRRGRFNSREHNADFARIYADIARDVVEDGVRDLWSGSLLDDLGLG